MNVVVQLSTRKGLGMESNRMKFDVQVVHGKNGCKSIIQGVGFHHQRLLGNPVCKDQSGSEGFFE